MYLLNTKHSLHKYPGLWPSHPLWCAPAHMHYSTAPVRMHTLLLINLCTAPNDIHTNRLNQEI